MFESVMEMAQWRLLQTFEAFSPSFPKNKYMNSFFGREEYKIKLLTTIDGIKVYLINSSILSQKFHVWNTYLGSHHYGKKSSHIPEDEIFISDKTPENEIKRVILHEYVERAIMKVLETQYNMSPEQAWEIAHYFVKNDLGL